MRTQKPLDAVGWLGGDGYQVIVNEQARERAMTENPFATREQREELRREALEEIAMGAVGFCHDIPVALDGLDIAEKMAKALVMATFADPDGCECELCVLSRRWQDWQAKRADGGHGSIGGG